MENSERNKIKSFIYLDDYKMLSISSQLFEGMTQFITHSEINGMDEVNSQKGAFASGRFMADMIIQQSIQSETKYLHDFAFNLFEKELNDRGLLYNVKSEDSIEDIQQKGFVKVTGRILFSDYGRIKDTIVNFNDLGRAFGELSLNSTMGQFNEISEQIRNIRDRNAKAKSKQAAKQVQSQIDVLLKDIGLMQDERLIQNLSTIMNYGYRDDLDVRIAIEGSDLCCTAIINPDYLKEPVRILLSKYSRITEIDFTVIGIITQSGVEKITFPQPEGETIKTTTQNLTEQIGVLESQFNGRMRNEYIIDPIAIYSEL